MMYFLQTIICSAIFYIAFYFLFKEKDEHVFNRFYLLTSLLLAVIIPLFSIPVFPEYIDVVARTGSGTSIPKEIIEVAYSLTWKDVLLAIYLLGFCLHAILLIRRLSSIYKITKTGIKKTSNGITTVLTTSNIPVSSFFHYLFIPKEEEETISEYEVIHEGVHIKQKHSWDILFVECIRIVFWFNPIILLYKKRIVEIHEYLADQETSKELGQEDYEQFLAIKTYTPKKHAPQLIHNFYSLFEKRIKMLNSNESTKKWQFSLVLPIIAMTIMAFSFENYPVYNVQESNLIANEQDSFPPIPPHLVGQELDTIISFDPVTYEERIEYVVAPMKKASPPKIMVKPSDSPTGVDTIITFYPDTYEEVISYVDKSVKTTEFDTLVIFDPADFSETIIIIDSETGQAIDTIR